jgi:hypothetical protein
MTKLITALPFALVLLAGPAYANPSLDAVLQKHFDAQGGLARLKGVSSMVIESRSTFDGATTTYATQKLRPNLWRTEFTENGASVVKGFDGESGWVSKDGNVELMAADKVAKMKKNTIDDALVDPAATGWKVELAGSESVDGAPAHVILMTHRDGDTQRRYIDQKSNLEVKRVYSGTYEGKSFEKVAKFSNWKKVNGITVAMTTEYAKDGKTGVSNVTRIEFDAPLKATAFAPPAAAKSAPVKAAAAR